MRVHVVAFFVLAWFFLPAAPAQSAREPEQLLGCVRTEKLACGCYIRIRDSACTKRSASNAPHLFTGLNEKDPLLLNLVGLDIELPHTRHQGKSVKGDAPGRWADEYGSKEVAVRITYAPGESTCTKPKPETCEYTDYNATVVLQGRGHRERTFKASVVCGC